ncbi:MAG: VirD4-like conjugal transfer protein, CD1115 family, partial [Oscillospiraceae bacterium]
MAKQQPQRKKDIWDYAPYFVVIAACIVIGIFVGYVVSVTASPKHGVQWSKVLDALPDYINAEGFSAAFKSLFSGGYTLKGALIGAFGGVMFFLYNITKTEKRFHRKGEEHGSARWGTDEEKKIVSDPYDFYNNAILASDIYLVIDRKLRDKNKEEHEKSKKKKTPAAKIKKTNEKSKKTDEFPLGESDNEKLSVSAVKSGMKKSEKIQPMLNLNMLILGGSGTGKSRFFVKPNLMQCNTSYVVTDPSGELLQSCGKMLEREGYIIKIFNIDDMRHSSNYNPFHYVREDGEINANAVLKMINTFMANTQEGEGQSADPFWDKATKLLLSAVCFLIVETAPSEEEQNFSQVLEIIHKKKVDGDDNKEQSEFDLMFEDRRAAEPNALSVQYYDEFMQAAGKTMQSILISTTTRLQHFKLPQVRNLTHTDNIGLDTLGDQKTALFIIIPSTDKTYNFLAAMMYTQLFDVLYSKAIKTYHGRLPYHVRFILDEFANVGKIPEFETVLATCRKFEISAQIILQNLSQLKRFYEKSWEEIPGNCDTTIFLGGKDQTNNEYIMKELGKETIDTLSINKTRSKNDSTGYNNAIMGRELMQLDELATMPNNECLVLIRGMRPFRTDKFDILNHPRYNMLDEADREHNSNTYNLTDIDTKEELEVVEGLVNYNTLENNENEVEFDSYKIRTVTETGEKIVPISELRRESDIPAEITSLFEGA